MKRKYITLILITVVILLIYLNITNAEKPHRFSSLSSEKIRTYEYMDIVHDDINMVTCYVYIVGYHDGSGMYCFTDEELNRGK